MMEIVGEPKVTDIVLARAPYIDHDKHSRRSIEPFRTAMAIGPEVSIEPIDPAKADAIMDACHARGENFTPVRQFGAPYAFVRRVESASVAAGLGMDPDRRLYTCVALSRLIHPTGIGFEYAARVRKWVNGARQIVPNTDHALNPYAFVQYPNENWLNPSDIPNVARLVQAYLARRPPLRVVNALWHYEYAARAYFVDNRWLELTIALEGLIHIRNERLSNGSRVGSTRAFVRRLGALRSIDDSLAMSEADLHAMYEERSRLAHGQALGNLSPPVSLLYERLDAFVRAVLRKAVQEPSFAAIFENDTMIRSALPVT